MFKAVFKLSTAACYAVLSGAQQTAVVTHTPNTHKLTCHTGDPSTTMLWMRCVQALCCW